MTPDQGAQIAGKLGQPILAAVTLVQGGDDLAEVGAVLGLDALVGPDRRLYLAERQVHPRLDQAGARAIRGKTERPAYKLAHGLLIAGGGGQFGPLAIKLADEPAL